MAGNNIDTGLRDTIESQVATSAGRVDEADYEYQVSNATRTGADRSIKLKESAKAGAQATIENPPMKTVTDSSKKGSSSRQVVDENAVSAARAELAQLEVEISNLQSEKDSAHTEENAAKGKKDTEQASLDENTNKLATFNNADKLLNKFEDVFNGKDRFASEGDEKAALERLKTYTDKIKEWGDLDKDGVDDGKAFADAVDGFLNGQGGYLSKPREYGVMPEAQTNTTTNAINDPTGTGVAGDTSSSDLYGIVMGHGRTT